LPNTFIKFTGRPIGRVTITRQLIFQNFKKRNDVIQIKSFESTLNDNIFSLNIETDLIIPISDKSDITSGYII
jgi:hypothetical protein